MLALIKIKCYNTEVPKDYHGSYMIYLSKWGLT
jgi:hypothetical protein